MLLCLVALTKEFEDREDDRTALQAGYKVHHVSKYAFNLVRYSHVQQTHVLFHELAITSKVTH